MCNICKSSAAVEWVPVTFGAIKFLFDVLKIAVLVILLEQLVIQASTVFSLSGKDGTFFEVRPTTHNHAFWPLSSGPETPSEVLIPVLAFRLVIPTADL
jgi:hypothetical protein